MQPKGRWDIAASLEPVPKITFLCQRCPHDHDDMIEILLPVSGMSSNTNTHTQRIQRPAAKQGSGGDSEANEVN